MTLEQLRIFVAEREHMTEAAKALNLTQSATSAAVAALEVRHGVQLFDRVGRRIKLTEAGRLFLPEARAVLARAEEAVASLDDLTGLKRGNIALVAGVCGTDLHIVAGNQIYLAYPRVIGHELAATGEEAPQGSDLAPGDLVSVLPYISCGLCDACHKGRPNCCRNIGVLGLHRDGGMAEFL